MCTALQANRLEKTFASLNKDDIEAFVFVFEKYKNFKWILLGQANFKNILKRWPTLKKYSDENRFIHLGFVKEFRGFCKKIDGIFVMPNMTGGNQGVCAAMYEGASAIVPTYSDSSGIVPNMGQYTTTKDAISLLISFVENKIFRSKLKNACIESINSATSGEASEEWISLLSEISNFGKKRLIQKKETF